VSSVENLANIYELKLFILCKRITHSVFQQFPWEKIALKKIQKLKKELVHHFDQMNDLGFRNICQVFHTGLVHYQEVLPNTAFCSHIYGTHCWLGSHKQYGQFCSIIEGLQVTVGYVQKSDGKHKGFW